MGFFTSQLETRSRLDEELLEQAYARLSSSISQDTTGFWQWDEGDDGATKACLKYLGVEPGKVPERVEDAAERLAYLCRPSGTMYRKIRLEKGWHKDSFGAILGKLTTGEMVALLPGNMHGYLYSDPATGKRIHVDDKIEDRFSSDAILFYRPLPTRPLSTMDLLVFLLKSFSPGDWTLILVMACIATLAGLLPAWANHLAYATVVPSGNQSLILPIASLLLGVAVSRTLINACRALVSDRISLKMGVQSEAAIFARMLSLPAGFFKQYDPGNLGMRVSQISSMAQMLTSLLLNAGLTAIFSLIYVFQIGVFAPGLGLPAFLIVLAQATMLVLSAVLTMRYDRKTLEEKAQISGSVTSLLRGSQKIKLAGAEKRAFARWAKEYSGYANLSYSRPVIVTSLPVLVTIVGTIGASILFYIAGRMKIDTAGYMAFSVAYGQVSAAIMAFSSLAGQMLQMGPMLDMARPILDATPEAGESKTLVSRLSGSIEVNRLSFRYSKETPYILQDLSLAIKSGEYVGIVGKSGSGKSTLLRLLMGFETAETGAIFYGSYEMNKIDKQSLRSHIGIVMQNSRLLSGDIFSNITIAAANATEEDAWKACEMAGIAEDIRSMPMGMRTMISEGNGGISGGQRQRLLIARAICGKKKILMFDEATSALDNIAQKHVSDALDTLKCTRIVVAHRLSTVKHCDRILVVDGGKIAEEGTYEQLIEKNGIFAKMVERQRLDK